MITKQLKSIDPLRTYEMYYEDEFIGLATEMPDHGMETHFDFRGKSYPTIKHLIDALEIYSVSQPRKIK